MTDNLDDLERAAATLDAARTERDDKIRRHHAAGLSLRAIAEAVGVSHETVRRIIAQTT